MKLFSLFFFLDPLSLRTFCPTVHFFFPWAGVISVHNPPPTSWEHLTTTPDNTRCVPYALFNFSPQQFFYCSKHVPIVFLPPRGHHPLFPPLVLVNFFSLLMPRIFVPISSGCTSFDATERLSSFWVIHFFAARWRLDTFWYAALETEVPGMNSSVLPIASRAFLDPSGPFLVESLGLVAMQRTMRGFSPPGTRFHPFSPRSFSAFMFLVI